MADLVLTVFEVSFCVCLVLGAPGFLFKRLRGLLAWVFLAGTCICYFAVWLWCAIMLAMTWGALPLIVGLVLGIAGVVPVAIVMMLFTGYWGLLLNVVLMLAGATALRVAFHAFRETAQTLARQKAMESKPVHVIEAQDAWDRAGEALNDDPTKQVPY